MNGEGGIGSYELAIPELRKEELKIKFKPAFIDLPISVIIPVRNAGKQLETLLRKLMSQKKVRQPEIIILDTESEDDTVNIAKSFSAKVLNIKKEEFNHGTTRNFGAAVATGSFLFFTVQDALPVSDYYLYNMLVPFYNYPYLGAVSSKQSVKAEADLYTHFEYQGLSTIYRQDAITLPIGASDRRSCYDISDGIKNRFLLFFDNVSSCIKADVFREIQFSHIGFGEDMEFAIRLVQKNFALGFLRSTGVYHWHDRPAGYYFKRGYLGIKAVLEIFRVNIFEKKISNMFSLDQLVRELIGLFFVTLSIVHFVNEFRQKHNIRTSGDLVEVIKVFLSQGIFRIPKSDWFIRSEDFHQVFNLLEEISNSPVVPLTQGEVDMDLVKYFLSKVNRLIDYIGSSFSLEDRCDQVISCLWKRYADFAGAILAYYYVETKTSGMLSDELKRIDYLLGKGVCYS